MTTQVAVRMEGFGLCQDVAAVAIAIAIVVQQMIRCGGSTAVGRSIVKFGLGWSGMDPMPCKMMYNQYLNTFLPVSDGEREKVD